MPDEGPVMSALDHARDVLREWESGDRYYPGSEDRLYSALHGLVAARGAAEALTPGPGPCPAEAYSWDFYRPEQTDPYWMRCRKSEGHDGEHQSDEGAQWSEPTVRCPGCDLDPVGYAPHNGKGDCPPIHVNGGPHD